MPTRSTSVWLWHRPVRIGLCLGDSDPNTIAKAMRTAFTLWGGPGSPIIPVHEQEAADRLVRIFSPDVLVNVTDDPAVDSFIAAYPFLKAPLGAEELFTGDRANFADLYHPVRAVQDRLARLAPAHRTKMKVFQWSENDPLHLVLLATLGGFPKTDDVPRSYDRLVDSHLDPVYEQVLPEDPLPASAATNWTIRQLAMAELHRYRAMRASAGVFVGSVDRMEDLVNYWNAQVGGQELVFYDPRYEARLGPVVDHFLSELPATDEDNWADAPVVVCREKNGLFDHNRFDRKLLSTPIRETYLIPPYRVPHWATGPVASSSAMETDGNRRKVRVQIVRSPNAHHPSTASQQVVYTLTNWLGNETGDDDTTLYPPHIPELSGFYSRSASAGINEIRSDMEGLSVISDAGAVGLSLRPIGVTSLFKEVFGLFGIRAEPSDAGLRATRLIRQVGGLQGLRVFKLPGVRDLVTDFEVDAAFKRSAAQMRIGNIDPATHQPQLEKFDDLYIDGKRVTPSVAFDALSQHKLLRPGLEFRCPDCGLDFWKPLEALGRKVSCEFCTLKFDCTPQLRDRDWSYRRSSLMGRRDQQLGAIPVALTLLQLKNHFHDNGLIYHTSLNLSPIDGTEIPKCETDFAVLMRTRSIGPGPGRWNLVIGECKGRLEIDKKDIENLVSVSKAIRSDYVDPFVLISKADHFTPEEIDLGRWAYAKTLGRFGMLSVDNLEPHRLFARTELEIPAIHYGRLEELAYVTNAIHLGGVELQYPTFRGQARDYYELWYEHGSWVLKRRGNRRATRTFSTKAAAVTWAKAFLRGRTTESELTVHRADGSIQSRAAFA